ncbi:MAG: hypothetical protein LBT59_30435 [Clostridiales bacterium]|nr:hypothetical protein [Clostridiales bacterium]
METLDTIGGFLFGDGMDPMKVVKTFDIDGQQFYELDEKALIASYNGNVSYRLDNEYALENAVLDKYPNTRPMKDAKSLFTKCLKKGIDIISCLEREAALTEWLDNMQEIAEDCRQAGDIHNAIAAKCLFLSTVLNVIVFPSPEMLQRGHDTIDSIGKDFEGLDADAKEKAFVLAFECMAESANFDTGFQRVLIRDVLFPNCPGNDCRTRLEQRILRSPDEDEIAELRPLLNSMPPDNPKYKAKLAHEKQSSLIEEALDRKDFDEALKLCQNQGTGLDLSKYQLELSENISNTGIKRELLKSLALKDAQHFQKFKNAYSEDEWRETALSLVKDCEGTPLYIQLVIDQDLKGKMLELCMNNPSLTADLAERILPDSKELLAKLFVKNIYDKAEAATCRKDLREVCNLITKYKELFNVADNSLKEDFMKKNNRNRAFLEELRRVR